MHSRLLNTASRQTLAGIKKPNRVNSILLRGRACIRIHDEELRPRLNVGSSSLHWQYAGMTGCRKGSNATNRVSFVLSDRLARANASRTAIFLLCSLFFLLIIPVTGACAISDIPTPDGAAALVLHPDTGSVVYAKNPDKLHSPSSLVKIMTALVVLETVEDISTEVEVSAEALSDLSGLSTMGLQVGERLSIENLLIGLLLPSGGDAANVLAESVSGSVESFVEAMNRKARALGMDATHFANAHGRDDERQMTTARDMALLAVTATRNQKLADICGTQYKRIPRTNLSAGDRYYFSNNALVISNLERRKTEDYYYAPAHGLMTGFSAAAGYNIMATAKRGNLSLVCIVLGASRDPVTGNKMHYEDTISLFQWCYENLQLVTLLQKQAPVCEIDIRLSTTRDKLTLVSDEQFSALIPAAIAVSDLEQVFHIDQPIEAPVSRGEALGYVVYLYEGQTYGICPLSAQSDVSRNLLLLCIDRLGRFWLSKWAVRTVLGVVVLSASYLLLAVAVNRARQKRREKQSLRRHRARKSVRREK